MPIPIRPIGNPVDKADENSSSFLSINVDMLANAVSDSINKLSSTRHVAEATDDDAEILVDLWNQSEIVSEAEKAEDKRYSVPKEFDNSVLMRLKAANLINGDSNIIHFTNKAIRVIKTIVLSEPNAFTKGAIKKPYSVILAENKSKALNHNPLAFQKNAGELGIIKNAQRRSILNDIINDTPFTLDNEYIKSYEMVNNNPPHNKKYIIRLFKRNNLYYVQAWWGRNTPGARLSTQLKGEFNWQLQAEEIIGSLVGNKRDKGYVRVLGNTTDNPQTSEQRTRDRNVDTQHQATEPEPQSTETELKTPPVTKPKSKPKSKPDKNELTGEELLEELEREFNTNLIPNDIITL